MSVQAEIESKLRAGIPLEHMELENESHQHNVPTGSESHFKLVLVSNAFTDKALVARHQLIYSLLEDEVRNKIHALALHTYTPDEWQKRHQQVPLSPECRGGSKASSQ